MQFVLERNMREGENEIFASLRQTTFNNYIDEELSGEESDEIESGSMAQSQIVRE